MNCNVDKKEISTIVIKLQLAKLDGFGLKSGFL